MVKYVQTELTYSTVIYFLSSFPITVSLKSRNSKKFNSNYFIFPMSSLHEALSWTKGTRSWTDECTGQSIMRLPSLFINCWTSGSLNFRLLLPCHKIWPNHLCLRMRMLWTMFRLQVLARASWRIVLPVILASITLLTPLILRHVVTFRSHVSDP